MKGDAVEPISPISQDRQLRLAAYIGVLAAYLASVKADPLTPAQVAFFLVAALWSLAVEHRFRKPFFSTPVKIGLITLGGGIFVIFIFGNSGVGTENFANSISRFLFWNAVVFVLSRNKTEYDLWTLAIIELSLFMISGSFIQPPTFLPLLLISVACFFIAFQRMSLLKCGVVGVPSRSGLGLAVVSLLFALEAGVAVFLFFPRDAFRMEKLKKDERAERPELPEGPDRPFLSDRVGIPRQAAFLRLVNFQKLKMDPTPVLRLRLSSADGKPYAVDHALYLRGAVLDTYENGEWHSDFRKLPRKDGDDGTIDGWTTLNTSVRSGRTIVRQHLQTVALSEDLAFALADPVGVAWKEARFDPAGVLFYPAVPRGVTEYDVESALMPTQIPVGPVTGSIPERYLQVPPGLARLKETAQRLTQGLGEGRNLRTDRMVRFLTRNGFTYKLDPFVPVQGRDPIEHFLETRTGYCVQFATALALMCRAAGVPARVATGFQVHDPEDDGSYIVRSSDAHAWVEVWFGPDHGWRVYDATPGAIPDFTPSTEGAPVATPGGAGKEEPKPDPRWDHFITDFDPRFQSEALAIALRRTRGWLSAAGRFLVSPLVVTLVFVFLAGMLVVYLFLPRRRKERLRQILSGFREPTTVDFYRDFLWTLSRLGLRKHPALTAREFARQAKTLILDDGIDFVTEKFCETRYGGRPVELEDRLRIDEVLARLAALTPRRGASVSQVEGRQ